jgi:predicted ATPase
VALHVARELLHRFEAVVLVELAAVRDPALVLPAIAAALGLRKGGRSSAADTLARELGDRAVLLVLDNVEQVIDAAPALGDLLARTGGSESCARRPSMATTLSVAWEPVWLNRGSCRPRL